MIKRSDIFIIDNIEMPMNGLEKDFDNIIIEFRIDLAKFIMQAIENDDVHLDEMIHSSSELMAMIIRMQFEGYVPSDIIHSLIYRDANLRHISNIIDCDEPFDFFNYIDRDAFDAYIIDHAII
jgi:hypothetical protein